MSACRTSRTRACASGLPEESRACPLIDTELSGSTELNPHPAVARASTVTRANTLRMQFKLDPARAPGLEAHYANTPVRPRGRRRPRGLRERLREVRRQAVVLDDRG